MGSSNLKFLLNEYSKKRDLAISIAKAKKANLFAKEPKLQEIEDNLSKCAISLSKSMLSSGNPKLIADLDGQISRLKKEKLAIYKKLHIDDSFFLPEFSCTLCNDTGYVSNGYTSELCNCIKQKLFNMEYNKYNVYNMNNDTFDKFNISYYSKKIDKDKFHCDISPRDNMEQILKICKSFIENFDDEKEKNLLFTGNSGLGKTFLSNCIANQLLSTGKTVLYQTAPVMLDTILNYRFRKK